MGLRKRIESWLLSANCNCSEGVYCTYCEILSDVLVWMRAAETIVDSAGDIDELFNRMHNDEDESEESNNVEHDSVGDRRGGVAVERAEAEADAGGQAPAGEPRRREASEGSSGPEGVTYEEHACDYGGHRDSCSVCGMG